MSFIIIVIIILDPTIHISGVWFALFADNKNKALQSSTGAGPHYNLPATGGVVTQQGVVQTGGGADPINALQNLTKQPVPPGMTQPGNVLPLFPV